MSYEATVRVPDRPVGHKDIVFKIRRDDSAFGRLKVSKGGVVWLPGNKSRGYRLSWAKLDELAREYGRRGSYPV